MPWFRTLPPGRVYAFKNRLLPCSSGTLEWIMFSFAWTGNAAGAKDAMCSAFAKRLWLGVLLVTITSARPTLQGTELKKKMKSKMWFNVMKFLWLLLAFNPLYLIYIPNVVKYVCDDLNTNFNKLYNWSIVTSVDQFNEATCIMSMFTIQFSFYVFYVYFH